MNPPDPRGEPDVRVHVAATLDAITAERWRDALELDGIDAAVEPADERTVMPGQNPLVGQGGSPSGVVYAVMVPPADRDRALAGLAAANRAAPDGDEAMPSGAMLRGALVVVGLSLGFFAVVIALASLL